ncbi:hypothetical protein BDV35DRAFT_13685 [Aspergillus flavus]|uniref:NACHT domain-containing protein n=1 Tax=Aspergillus flavus TaxID=5059 RepID=A0A5N6GMA5_ASPFL|nr:hypothetical protein BDV35DRAFT_13685 [Aspergillus flavus]
MSNHIDIKGNIAQQGATQVNNVNFNIAHTTEDIDRLCLRTLRCPDSLVVKHRLKENKDKLLPQSIEWILQALEYKSWRDGDKLCLLWIKGGAGKGKTMMSIGIIERLLLRQDGSTVVTYFFCQNADYELNSLEAIIKGLILQLANRQEALKKCLRDRWDSMKNCFTENVTSWRTLWNILLEMLDQCNCQRVYIIVDALDECQDDGMADFLKLIVRNGLDQPSKIKWLLTSRPLDSAQRELLAGHDQVQVSLELNSEHVSEAVKNYITEKVQELDRRARYGETLKREIETKLTIKAEDTFLWVSLVCKELESVHRDMALATIQSLPPGLQPFYDRIFHQLSEGEQADVKRYMRLLKVMMLVYRPLNVEEVGSVTGLTEEGDTIQVLVDQCASFIRMHENKIEFVHQSARDYLAGTDGKSILDSHGHYGHEEIVQNCLSFLLKYLKVNLIGLAQPDSTRESLKTEEHKRQIFVLDSVNYAATFWVQHFEDTMIIEGVRRKEGVVSTFLDRRLLEWLECLSLLDSLPQAIGALRTLANAVKVGIQYLLDI